jgi:tetratricopeptide (TPR) repeat protein
MRANFEDNSWLQTRAAFLDDHLAGAPDSRLEREVHSALQDETSFEDARPHASKPRLELRQPKPASADQPVVTVFPYIPRKRQERNGLLIDYLYLPAAQEAGDQVDFLILGENRVGVLLADVSGKLPEDSAPVLKTVLRSNSTGLSAAATLRYLEQALKEACVQDFHLTAFYAIFDQNKRLLNFASAGHLPMMLYRPSLGKIFLLNTPGAPLGENASENLNGKSVTSLSNIEGAKAALKQNDLLVLYSDGVLAARNKRKEVFGRQRLVEFLAEHGDLEPTAFLIELRRFMEKFTEGQAPQDDLTVIVLKNILRNLDKPHAEAADADLAAHFMSTEQEHAILAVLRANHHAGVEEILARLNESEERQLTREQVQAYVEQNGRWLKPWPAREEKSGEESNGRAAADSGQTQMLAAAQRLQNELIAAFPIQNVLAKQYEFKSKNAALAQAQRSYHNGDYAQALASFSRLRASIKNSAAVHCFFGNLHLLLHEPAQAQHEFFEALNFDPRNSHALVALSYVALLKGELTMATESLAAALRMNAELEDEYQPFFQLLITATNGHDEHSDWLI